MPSGPKIYSSSESWLHYTIKEGVEGQGVEGQAFDLAIYSRSTCSVSAEMPRKPRIEYPAAVYHVLNRGNYRTDLFSLEKTGESFEETLLQACSRFGWRLFAYVLISNHYHLA